MWIPVGDPVNRDWMQIGDVTDLDNFLGKSHVQSWGYPSWGDDAT